MSNTSSKKSPSVEAFLAETIAESKQLKNINLSSLRKARSAAKGFNSTSSYLDHLETEDLNKQAEKNRIMLDSNTPLYLGTFYVPSWLATYLTDEDEMEDEYELRDPRGNNVLDDIEEWKQSISKLDHSINFTIVGKVEYPEDLISSGSAYKCTYNDDVIEVVATGYLSTLEAIKVDYAIRKDVFERRYHEFRTMIANKNIPMLPLTDVQCGKLMEQLPEEFNGVEFIAFLSKDHMMQSLFYATDVI